MKLGASGVRNEAVARLALFVLLWLMIAGWSPKDLPVGLAAAGAAVWVSLALLPAGGPRPNLAPLIALTLRFLRGSVVAGVDVARRALSPRLDINPGFIACPLTLADGPARNAFCLQQSLQPGALPTGVEQGNLMVHVLDLGMPAAASLAADEALFKAAAGHE
jgi:multicomponent Na+:H+ antiporter subunit E